ncbi:hypothetical protein C1T17_09495 [Sphingobium sp. SCG-1]|uniref:hypothetical protein n=1 Tax=Sphingobium sp. SCG-1 TaxID=2072936 RepID=UPI000CD69C0A|nr:hypothetical protein [Sphingobium sp. SCG-1]AUW58301.1 hypothetical protein C1T17_09495 [Sphingobium sp. SCG-1]
MADDTDTRISPTLHPGIAGEIADYDDETRPLLGQTETAVDAAFKALQSIHNAKEGAALNPSLNPFEQLVAVDDHANKVMSKVYGSWSRAVDALNNNVTAMEKDLYAPVESKASRAMATEIRQHFAGLETDGKRMGALRKAIEAGDETTATAVLGAPSYLSGLSEELHAEYLRDWHNAQRPVEAKKIRAMRAAADMLNNRYQLLTKAVEKAVGVHEEYHEDRQGRRTLARTWTAGEIRNRVKASNERFAVPV